MPDVTDLYALPFPEDSDSPDIPRDFRNLAEKIDPLLSPRAARAFADASSRDNFFATYGAPVEGQMVYMQDEDVPRYWDGAQWVWSYHLYLTKDADINLTANIHYDIVWDSETDIWYQIPEGVTKIPITLPNALFSIPRKGIYSISFHTSIVFNNPGVVAYQIQAPAGRYWLSDLGQYVPAGVQVQLGRTIIHTAVPGEQAVARIIPSQSGTLLAANLRIQQLR